MREGASGFANVSHALNLTTMKVGVPDRNGDVRACVRLVSVFVDDICPFRVWATYSAGLMASDV